MSSACSSPLQAGQAAQTLRPVIHTEAMELAGDEMMGGMARKEAFTCSLGEGV